MTNHDPGPAPSALGDVFDRSYRALHGIPDATFTKATTLTTVHPVLEVPETFIVQTARHRERGDTIFVQYIGQEGTKRLQLPPAVAECIARQREALTTKGRKQRAKAEAARRKAAGIKPGFLKKKGG